MSQMKNMEELKSQLHDSTGSLDSQEQLEAALRDLMHQSGQQGTAKGFSS